MMSAMASPCSEEDAAAENRRNFPFAAATLDDFRAVFGPGVKLVNATENGKKIGNFRQVGSCSMNLAQWFRLSDLIEFERKNRKQGKGSK